MNVSPELDVSKIVNGFYRRKGLIIAFFVVVFCLSAYLTVSLPNVYRSSSLILISPQRLPPAYITSTVTSTIQERIHAIIQRILSRTSLEKIVKEFGLFPSTRFVPTTEDRVEQLRKRININVREDKNDRDSLRSSTFLLSFDAETPEKATQVTARLTSLLVDENLKVREQEAVGTTAFINTEAERIRKELEEQESQVNQFKAKYRFELPDQLEANLRTLEQLRRELQANTAQLSALQERKAGLEKQLVEAEASVQQEAVEPNSYGEQAMPREKLIERRKTQLEVLLRQYSEKHPDIINLKREIQTLESAPPIEEAKTKGSASTTAGSGRNPVVETLRRQMADVQFETTSVKSKSELLRREIASYQARVDGTPLRAIDLAKVTRNYEITLKKYQDLQAKTLESQLSENMEKRQKGEQFQILDPPSMPEKPVSPNRPLILLMGLLGGLFGGFGLALLLENLDTTFKSSDELEGYVNRPLLATIPTVITRESVLQQRRAQRMLVLASVGILVVGIVSIHVYRAFVF